MDSVVDLARVLLVAGGRVPPRPTYRSDLAAVVRDSPRVQVSAVAIARRGV